GGLAERRGGARPCLRLDGGRRAGQLEADDAAARAARPGRMAGGGRSGGRPRSDRRARGAARRRPGPSPPRRLPRPPPPDPPPGAGRLARSGPIAAPLRRFALGELVFHAAWGGTLVYAGALLVDSYGTSSTSLGLALALGATAFLPGTFLAKSVRPAAAAAV